MALVEDNSGRWRVGVLNSQTGVTASIERTRLNGTLLAIEEINANGAFWGRRAHFVGLQDYMEAGGTLLRDLFTEDRGGYLEDVALLDLLVTAKLGREADRLRETEGWKWTEAHLDFPQAHGMRRVCPHPVELSTADQASLDAVRSEVDQLAEWLQTADELPDHVEA
jgi:ParB family chromosome partitioning protein